MFPGFGVVDLSVTWSSDWPQVLEAGWGLFFTVLVGFPFIAVAVRPGSSGPPVAQLAVATLALGVSVVAAREAPLVWVPVVLAVETVTVAWLAGRSRGSGTASRGAWSSFSFASATSSVR